jgi:phenylpyruvate tautomerase PptA (4-oxalocrotonate tautomerase family)
MPHLRFDMNFDVSPEEKGRFAAAVVRHFSSIMDTGTDHIAVALHCREPGDIVFGRSAASGGRAVLLDADIRLGRSRDQKRRLALAVVSEAQGIFGVAPEGVYVVYTEHDGENFQLSDRVLPSWSEGEDPLADRPRRPSRRAGARRRQVRGGGAARRRGGRG